MKCSPKAPSKAWLPVFILVSAATILQCAYLEGRAAELARRSNEHQEMVDKALDEKEYWRDRYATLAHETDYLTVITAERRYQEASQ